MLRVAPPFEDGGDQGRGGRPDLLGQRTKRSGVHLPVRRCFSRMCSAMVVWRPRREDPTWLATRQPG